MVRAAVNSYSIRPGDRIYDSPIDRVQMLIVHRLPTTLKTGGGAFDLAAILYLKGKQTMYNSHKS